MATEESVCAAPHNATRDHQVHKSVELFPGVWVLTLNDPDTHNTLTPTMIGPITRELD